MTTTVRFTKLEEAVYHIEETFRPWTIQLELESAVAIDVDRLERAAVTACETHPLARARRRPHSDSDTGYVWEIPASVEGVEVRVAESSTALADVREAFYGEPVDLTEAPPFRLLVARGAGVDGGDRLLVALSHVPVDGVGAVRLLRSICQAYRGQEPDADPVDLPTSRSVLDEQRPSVGDRLGLLTRTASRLQNAVDSPARIAEDGGGDGEGWGFVDRELDPARTERLVADRPEGVSVNDRLVAALHLAIGEWNADHGRSAGKVTTTVPVNVRPEAWFYDVVGMYALFVTVSTRRPNRRDPASAVEKVARQTARAKRQDHAAGLYEALELIPSGTPVGIKQQLPELLRGPGRNLLDTAVVSNIGRLPTALPGFDADDGARLWFSPPCWGPTPVGIGVSTVDGAMRFTFRYTAETFDRAAADAFADCYLRQLDEVV